MSGPTRDGTAEPVSRGQILRRERGQGNVHFPCSADHEQDWQPYPVDSYSAISADHTYIPRGTWSLLCRGATKSRAHPFILSSLPLHINISIDVNGRFDLTLAGGAMLKSHVRFDFLTRRFQRGKYMHLSLKTAPLDVTFHFRVSIFSHFLENICFCKVL